MTPVQGIKQVNSLKILGVTFQNNNRSIERVNVNLISPGLFTSFWAGGGHREPPYRSRKVLTLL